MNKYYEKDGHVIYNSDCLNILKQMPDKSFDLVLTDPPYGIATVWKGGGGHGWGKARKDTEERNKWDSETPPQEYFEEMLRIGKVVCIWGGNYFNLPISRGWLIWTKPERNFTLSEAELAWTSVDTVMRVFDGVRSDFGRVHPTQKPIELMRWCLDKLSKESDTILDPFMGSGTTLVAAKQLHRKAVGIEISEKYCEIARDRLSQEMLF